MMKCRKVLAGALAVAACFFGGVADAALPEEQIDFILNLPVSRTSTGTGGWSCCSCRK